MLGLLAEDLAHIDPDALGRAIDRHVMSSPYMPKAADLIKLAQSMQAPQTTLDAYAEELNELRCTRANGWRWQVRTNADGQRYLDRNDGQEGPERWQPREGEGRATQEVAAILVEQGTGQRLFDDMVRRGAVSRMVDDHLSGS